MVPRTLELHPSTLKRLVRLSKEAERDGSYRVAKRLQAVVMNAEGYSSGEIARILKAPRSKTSGKWFATVRRRRRGRFAGGTPIGSTDRALDEKQRRQLGDILDSGPAAYGLDTGIWTSPMISWIIEEEFGIEYHPGHVRKILHEPQWSPQNRPIRVTSKPANVINTDKRRSGACVFSTPFPGNQASVVFF